MKKNPGRKERRRWAKTALIKGYGKSDGYFWKRVADRRKKKKENSK
jgi:hypothetical protein